MIELEKLRCEIEFLRGRLAEIEILTGNIINLIEGITKILINNNSIIPKEVKDNEQEWCS